MEQRYGTDPSNRYGTEVWNGGMERVWSRTLFRTLYFDSHPYVFHIIRRTPQRSQTQQRNIQPASARAGSVAPGLQSLRRRASHALAPGVTMVPIDQMQTLVDYLEISINDSELLLNMINIDIT